MRRCTLLALLALLILAAGALARGQVGYEDDRLPALRRMAAHLRDDDVAAARTVLEDYLAENPCDATMQYNLACVLAQQGATLEARAALGRALALGYRDLDRVLADPDLQNVETGGLVAAHRDTLLARRDRASRSLIEDEWSEWTPLVPGDPACGGQAPTVEARIRYSTGNLQVEARRAAGDIEDWRLVVALPPGPDAFESDRTFVFTPNREGRLQLTQRNGRPVGGSVHKVGGGGRELRLTVPWDDLAPVAPPLDLEIGLDLHVDDASLVPDPYAGSRLVPWRRYAVFTLMPGEDPEPVLRGRLATTVLVGDTLGVDLAEQGLAAGSATLEVSLRDGWQGEGADAPVAVTEQDVRIEPDLAFLDTRVAMTPLTSPFYRLTVQLHDREGRTESWQTRGVRLEPDWFVRARERLDVVSPAERAIADRWLFFVLRELEDLDPREAPTTIARPVAVAESLLTRAETRGSLLRPDSRIVVAFPVSGERYHPGVLHVPARYRPGQTSPGLVLFAPTADAAVTAGGLETVPPDADTGDLSAPPDAPPVWQHRRDDPRVVLVVPDPPRADEPDYARQVVLAATTWLASLCRAETVDVAAWRDAGAPVLEAALTLPVPAATVRILPAGPLDPWPGEAAAEVAEDLPHATPTAPTFVLSYDEAASPKLKAIATALWRQGYLIQTVPVGDDPARAGRFLRDGR